jgi:uncharacterized protein YrrD
VTTAEGRIGTVKALVVDPRDSRVSHVVVEVGRPFARKERVLPISRISSFGTGSGLRAVDGSGATIGRAAAWDENHSASD